MLPRRAISTALLAMTLSLPGCCTISRLLCGPEKSQWVSVSLASPTATVATLLEAIRRDAPDVVYGCLSTNLRREYKLDAITTQIAWQRLRERVTGLHLAGYAEIPAPEAQTANSATFMLEVQGHRLRIDLVRESFRQLVYRRPNGTRGDSLVPLDSWHEMARIDRVDDPDFDKSRFSIEPFVFEHEGLEELPLSAIESAGLIRRWRISALHSLE